MDLQLTGKTALVTGSTAGIGLAIARTLAREGAEVVLNGRTKERIDAAVQEISAELPDARLRGVAADFGKGEEIRRLLEEVPEVDILVNNVGIFEPQRFEDIPDEAWFRFFEVNVMSGVRLSRHYLPKMLAANWGRILFVSSESAIFIPTEMIHYGTTKTAQLAVSRGMAELTRGTAVTVNTILPGPTFSEGSAEFIQGMADLQKAPVEEVERDFFRYARPTSILQRFATTQEVANLAVYLASPLASATNGAAVRVDGGVVKSII
ncbi:SDR family NAD(P)-dependent oxidoreductase [Larkinella soli]|uniref:SDR family NAD(P)-dependent oxidoreductase n=1 Tax=Larkinella soli TaxID=1770527 RepID=UPI000FFC5FC8|nr:SDR family oxidoreductase [Larkinella soli]